MTVATGIGSMPYSGSSSAEAAAAYDEALRVVVGEVPDLPHLPELPGRGAIADMTARALAVVTELGADLQPAGWRLTDAPGIDQRRARSLLAQDLDAVEDRLQDHWGSSRGTFKIQVAGPWTLAATVERPRGDRVLADHGARRELAQALADGVSQHVADVRRRVPGADLVVQVDEPALPAVLAGRVPTASGFHRHRSVDAPGASPALEWVFAAVKEAGATPIAHCCAEDVPLALLMGAGAEGVSVDLDRLSVSGYDDLATALESKRQVYLGVVPSTAPSTEVSDGALTERVLRLLDMLGLDPASVSDSLVVTPTCGLAGATTSWAHRALHLSSRVAADLGTS